MEDPAPPEQLFGDLGRTEEHVRGRLAIEKEIPLAVGAERNEGQSRQGFFRRVQTARFHAGLSQGVLQKPSELSAPTFPTKPLAPPSLANPAATLAGAPPAARSKAVT